MRQSGTFVRLLPWLLCLSALTLLGAAAWLQFLEGGSSTAGGTPLVSVVQGLSFVSFPVVGAVIAARLPANPYGWVWCAVGVAYGVLTLSAAVAESSTDAGWTTTALGFLAYVALAGLLPFVFLLFPTGRLPSPRWRWLPRTVVALGVLLALAMPFVPSALEIGTAGPWALSGSAGRVLEDLVTAGAIGMLLLILVAMASVLLRFRRAGPVERQQLKWFVLAAVVNGLYFAVDLYLAADTNDGWVLLGVLTVSLVPAAVAIAVLRYRLYDIDRIISRSVAYGLLTGVLVALYLLLVGLLGPLLEPLTGNSDLAVAGSTLAVAAAFNPARRRLQAAVDRRFDRARYDAGRAVDAYTDRLRSQVDLDQVTAGLRDTVVATVAPTQVAVWLRVPSRTGGA